MNKHYSKIIVRILTIFTHPKTKSTIVWFHMRFQLSKAGFILHRPVLTVHKNINYCTISHGFPSFYTKRGSLQTSRLFAKQELSHTAQCNARCLQCKTRSIIVRFHISFQLSTRNEHHTVQCLQCKIRSIIIARFHTVSNFSCKARSSFHLLHTSRCL